MCTRRRVFRNDFEVLEFRSPETLRVPFAGKVIREFQDMIVNLWIRKMLQIDIWQRPSVKSLIDDFGALLSTLTPRVVKADVFTWIWPDCILGTDGPLLNFPVLWENVFVPGPYEQQAYALQRYARIRETRSRLLGDDHPASIWSLERLACAYLFLYKPEDAVKLAQEIVHTYESPAKVSFSETRLIAMWVLAKSYYSLKQLDLATEFFKKVFEAQSKTLGRDHPATLYCQQFWLVSRHRAARRQDTLERITDIQRRINAQLGTDHHFALSALGNIAWLHYIDDDYVAGVDCFERAVSNNKRVLGMGHPKTAESIAGLTICRYFISSRGITQQLADAADICNRVLGPNCQRTVWLNETLEYVRQNGDKRCSTM